MADTKRVPGPTYYAPKVGLADKKDVYSKTNLRSSIQYSFGKAELPWQKKVKPVQGTLGRVRDTTERQVLLIIFSPDKLPMRSRHIL
jgi:hypothetical protein